MHVAIIGTGDVGRALAAGLVEAGHVVTLGSRHPNDPAVRSFVDSLEGEVDVTRPRQAADLAGAVLLAVPADAVQETLADLGETVEGKPLLDPANEVPADDVPVARRVAEAAPGAHVVKVFNTIGYEQLRDPGIEGLVPSMFVAGDDEAAVELAMDLADDLGFDPVRAGGLDAAHHLENLARFWIHLSRTHGREIGFALLRERD